MGHAAVSKLHVHPQAVEEAATLRNGKRLGPFIHL
jgi:hypothetical protein